MIRYIIFFILLTSTVQATAYLALDNQTIATEKELAHDPFLVLRAAQQENKKLPPKEFTLPYPAFDIINIENIFDHTTPYFYLESLIDNHCDKICWQISSDKDFRLLISNFEKIQDFENIVTIDLLTDTFFNPSQDYFFRVKGKCGESWTTWSEPFRFSVCKPSPVMNISYQKHPDNTIELSWEANEDPEAHYLVFASNTLDFTPCIYESDPQDSNLIAEIDSPRILIDDTFAYYRIVAEVQDHYSVPSPIIPIHSHEFSIESDTTNLSDWEKLTPYFLPEDHPIKAQLDSIFRAHKHALKDKKHLKKAGFRIVSQKEKDRHPAVVSHRKLPGYLIKAYTDKNKKTSDVMQLERRIIGAIAVTKAIDRYSYNHIFKVPKKWLYPISEVPNYDRKAKKSRKNFILVVEDMHLLEAEKNREKWKSSVMTEEVLEAIYTILNEVGLCDTLFPFNLPFSRDDGKLAFIDTEYYHHWPVDLQYLGRYLSPKGKKFWLELIESRVPRRQAA